MRATFNSLLCILALNPVLAQLDYEWLGQLSDDDGTQMIRLQDRDAQVRLTIYDFIASHYEVELIRSGQSMAFNVEDPVFNISCELSPDEKGRLVGTCHSINKNYEIELEKRVPLDAEGFDPYLGHYRTDNGAVFLVTKNQQTLHLHSPISGEYVVLKYLGSNRFHSRTGEYYAFDENPLRKESLEWIGKNNRRIRAQRFDPFTIEEIKFITRLDTLYGSLYLPKNKSELPAIMLALGAGRFDRHAYALEAEIMAGYGIASLVVDFPGTGKSTGNLHDNTFRMKCDMTKDVFRQLQQHSRIDAKRVGIRGGSQSGRIALMAAAELSDIAAVISVNVPVQTQMETQLYAIQQFLRSRGYDENTNIETVGLWQEYFEQIVQGKIDTTLLAKFQNHLNTHEGIYLPNPPNTEIPRSPHAEDLISDPTLVLNQIACPVLFQLAKLDERVPYESTFNNIQSCILQDNKNNMDIISYEFTSHNLMLPGYQIVPGLFMQKINWLKKHL